MRSYMCVCVCTVVYVCMLADIQTNRTEQTCFVLHFYYLLLLYMACLYVRWNGWMDGRAHLQVCLSVCLRCYYYCFFFCFCPIWSQITLRLQQHYCCITEVNKWNWSCFSCRFVSSSFPKELLLLLLFLLMLLWPVLLLSSLLKFFF